MDAALLSWVLHEARLHEDVESLLASFGRMLLGSGVPIFRIVLPLRARHPLVRVAGWGLSNTSKGLRVGTFAVKDADETWAELYTHSPLPSIVERGEEVVRRRLIDERCPMDFGILPELRELRVTDYVALGGELREGERVCMTFATRAETGFDDAHIAFLREASQAFLLQAELRLTRALAATIARTYLGARAGARVTAGDIHRGEVRRIDAVIGFCDLRGFTATSAHRSPEEITDLLNVWFDAIARPVDRTGGEILKFIGDAALVVWPTEGEVSRACAAAVDAAASLAASLPKDLRGGFALHRGEVAYGNIGATDRLDFTVIGTAVNLASRLEGLCATLDVPWLVSDAVAAPLGVPLHDLGVHTLKGFRDAVRGWGPLPPPRAIAERTPPPPRA